MRVISGKFLLILQTSGSKNQVLLIILMMVFLILSSRYIPSSDNHRIWIKEFVLILAIKRQVYFIFIPIILQNGFFADQVCAYIREIISFHLRFLNNVAHFTLTTNKEKQNYQVTIIIFNLYEDGNISSKQGILLLIFVTSYFLFNQHYKYKDRQNNMSSSEEEIKQLKMKTKIIIERLEQMGENVEQFIKFFYIITIVGKNVIGKLKGDGQEIDGNALYFEKKGSFTNILFGILQKGKLKGRGFLIKLFKTFSLENPQKLQFSALLLNDWGSENKQGIYYSRDKDFIQRFYKGSFLNDLSLRQGKLQIKKSGSLIKQYKGQFQNGYFHNDGEVTVPGQYRYKGRFQKSSKEGFGVEEDFQRGTVYIGEFSTNKKDGYGQITYQLKDKRIKLKGFWTDGSIQNQQAVFIDQKGEQLGLFDRHLTKFF